MEQAQLNLHKFVFILQHLLKSTKKPHVGIFAIGSLEELYLRLTAQAEVSQSTILKERNSILKMQHSGISLLHSR